jgi:lysophospholipase L1-like esterase
MQSARLIQWFFAFVGDVVKIAAATLVLLVLGHYAIGGALRVADRFAEKPRAIDPRVNSPVYASFPERTEFWLEHGRSFDARFEPYYHWRRNGFTGRFTNVSPEGVRRTVKAEASVPGVRKVFMFGGSTMWGTGAPDEKTIPSLLQSMLGSGYDVYNFGETAYVAAQELNYMLHQLARGNVPDVVIFYDGVNDGYAGAYSPAIPRDPQNLREEEKERRVRKGALNAARELFEASNYMRLVNRMRGSAAAASHGEWDGKVAPAIPKNSAAVIDVYEAHVRQVKALGRDYGFKPFFFWQPNLFSLTRKGVPFEDALLKEASPVLVQSQRAVYEAAKRRLSGRESEEIHFLGDIFDRSAEPIYIDWSHVGPNGNEIVAREMLQRIRGKL